MIKALFATFVVSFSCLVQAASFSIDGKFSFASVDVEPQKHFLLEIETHPADAPESTLNVIAKYGLDYRGVTVLSHAQNAIDITGIALGTIDGHEMVFIFFHHPKTNAMKIESLRVLKVCDDVIDLGDDDIDSMDETVNARLVRLKV